MIKRLRFKVDCEGEKKAGVSVQAAFTGDVHGMTESRIDGFTDLRGPVALLRTHHDICPFSLIRIRTSSVVTGVATGVAGV